MAEKHEKEELGLYEGSISRANALITSTYSSTLTENKITTFAFKKFKDTGFKDYKVLIDAEEIRALTGLSGNGLYETLQVSAKSMAHRYVFMEDSTTKSFQVTNLFSDIKYNKGTLEITLNNSINQFVNALTGNFTTMSLETLFHFKSNHSYRLYEILKVHEFKIGNSNKPILVRYSLAELRLQLNLINTEEEAVKKELQQVRPDVDKIVDKLAIKVKHRRWDSFRDRVLEVALKEINETTDLFIGYEPKKRGSSGKVVEVIFYIQKNVGQKEIIWPKDDKKKESPIVDFDIIDVDGKVIETYVDEQEDLISQVYDVLDGIEPGKLTRKSVISLLRDAHNDVELIKKCYEYSKTVGYIDNIVGYLRTLIKNGIEIPVSVADGNSKKADRINQVMEDTKDLMQNEQFKETMWEKLKQKTESMEAFIDYMSDLYMIDSIEELEKEFPKGDLTDLYFIWKRHNL